MQLTRTTILRLFKVLVAAAVIIIIAAYAIGRSDNYARGPEIDISAPTNGYAATTSTIEIIGRALRVNSLSLNGKQISVDERGKFDEIIIVFPGINFVKLEARDRFGRAVSKQLQIMGM
jgi:hypothetical protein